MARRDDVPYPCDDPDVMHITEKRLLEICDESCKRGLWRGLTHGVQSGIIIGLAVGVIAGILIARYWFDV